MKSECEEVLGEVREGVRGVGKCGKVRGERGETC